MTLTTKQARDAVMAVVKAAWEGSSAPADSLYYANTAQDRPGESGSSTDAQTWARVTVQSIASTQTTQGRRRWLSEGLVTVQVFTPIGDGYELADDLVRALLDGFRGHVHSADGVWFFDEVGQEVGFDGPWAQVNVTAGFRFQEVLS